LPSHGIGEHIGADRGADPQVGHERETRPGLDLGEPEIEPLDLELARRVADEVRLPDIAALVVEIVDVAHGGKPEQVPVRPLHEAAIENDVEAGAADERARRAGIGVGLEADAELAEAAPLGRGEAAVDLEQERLDPRPHLRRRVGAGERARKVAARHLVGAEAEIEDAELEPDPRQGGVVEKHALERADRRLVVAGRGRDLGEPEGQVEICRLAQHLREHRIVFRAGDDALRLGRCAQELGAERRRGDAQEPGTKLGSSCRHAPSRRRLFFVDGARSAATTHVGLAICQYEAPPKPARGPAEGGDWPEPVGNRQRSRCGG